MLERSEAERFLDTMRTARLTGDVATAVDLFDDDAVFSVVGLVSGVSGKEAVRAAITHLFESYEFLEWQPIRTFVDGDDIATRHSLKVRHRPSGAVFETETSEFFSMKNGRCSSFTQYGDTAKIAALSVG